MGVSLELSGCAWEAVDCAWDTPAANKTTAATALMRRINENQKGDGMVKTSRERICFTIREIVPVHLN
jgi:hypothetical protein